MKVERDALAKVLTQVAPATATKSDIQVLAQVWFDGKYAIAYNDIIGIKVPFASEIKGGVRHSLLAGLVENTRAKEMDLSLGGDDGSTELVVKATGMRARLAMYALSEMIFFEKMDAESTVIPLSDAFIAAFDAAMMSVGSDTTRPDYMGVALRSAEDSLDMLATDAKTLAWAFTASPKGVALEHTVLPVQFCERLLKLCKEGQIEIDREKALATSEDGVLLYGRLVHCPEPLDFDRVIAKSLPDGFFKKAVLVPPSMGLALDRIIAFASGTEAVSAVTIEGDVLRLTTTLKDRGELKDALKLPGGRHPEVKAAIDPVLFKRALGKCDRFLLEENIAVLGNEKNFVYIVAAPSKA